jgi:hypothetical protein
MMFRLLDRVEVVRDLDVPWYSEPSHEMPGYLGSLKTIHIAAGWVGDVVACVRDGGRKQTVITIRSATIGYALVDDADLRAAPSGR